MKKIGLYLGIAVLTFTSCVKDTVTETNSGRAIDFHVSTETRASETTTANLTTFYVTSLLEDGKTYFENLPYLRGADAVFMSTPAYYWPVSGSLNFYAYAPSADKLGGELTISKDSKKLTDFSPSSTISDQVDFVTANASGSKASNSGGVSLTFNHMLSQIEVHAKNAHEGYTYYVKGVSIKNVVSKADFDFTSTSDSPWNLSSAAEDIATYSVTYSDAVTLDALGKNVMQQQTVGEQTYSDNAMLIPQDLSDYQDAENNPKIGLYVQAVATASGAQVFPATVGGYDWMYVDIDTEWLPGCKYVYTLDLSQGAAIGEPITFTMNVTPWTEKSTLKDEEIDVTGTWRMSRIEITYTYDDSGRETVHEVYDDEQGVKDKINDDYYIVKCANKNEYYIYPGTENQRKYLYSIKDGILKVQFVDSEVGEFLVRDISDNFVVYSLSGPITSTDNSTNVTTNIGTFEYVYSYVRWKDIPLSPEIEEGSDPETGGDTTEP